VGGERTTLREDTYPDDFRNPSSCRSALHGFAVVDFATHQEVTCITLPDVPGAKKNLDGVQGLPSRGIGITPNGKTLWSTSKWYGYAQSAEALCFQY
jgi:hypothetical protein